MISPPPYVQTSGLTPYATSMYLPQEEDSVTGYRFVVLASDHGSGAAYWDIRCLARRVGSANPTNIIVTAGHQNSLAAATWSVTPTSDANGQIQISLLGGLGQTVDWMWSMDDVNAVSMVGPLP